MYRILVVGSNKDDFWKPIPSERFQCFKPIHLRHLHVQENKVGGFLLNSSDGLFAVFALPDYFHLVIIFQHAAYELSGQRLIINNYNFYYGVGHDKSPIASTRRSLSSSKGISIMTDKPPSETLTKS